MNIEGWLLWYSYNRKKKQKEGSLRYGSVMMGKRRYFKYLFYYYGIEKGKEEYG